MNNKMNEYKEIKKDEIIWIIFIILSILNIYGDNLKKDSIFNNNDNNKQKEKNIFNFTVIVSLLIYIYIAYRNYNKYKSLKETGANYSLQQIRFYGNVLVIIGFIFLVYFQLNEQNPSNPSIP